MIAEFLSRCGLSTILLAAVLCQASCSLAFSSAEDADTNVLLHAEAEDATVSQAPLDCSGWTPAIGALPPHMISFDGCDEPCEAQKGEPCGSLQFDLSSLPSKGVFVAVIRAKADGAADTLNLAAGDFFYRAMDESGDDEKWRIDSASFAFGIPFSFTREEAEPSTLFVYARENGVGVDYLEIFDLDGYPPAGYPSL